MHQRLGSAIYAGPEVHSAQLFTAAGLEIAEELSPVCGVTAEHQAHQQRPAGGFSAEHVDFTAEIVLSPSAQEAGVFVGLFLDAEMAWSKFIAFAAASAGPQAALKAALLKAPLLITASWVGPMMAMYCSNSRVPALLGGWPVIEF